MEKMNPEKINAVMCLVCGDLIASRHRHDFKFCKCGNVAVDGGKEYTRRCWNGKPFIELWGTLCENTTTPSKIKKDSKAKRKRS